MKKAFLYRCEISIIVFVWIRRISVLSLSGNSQRKVEMVRQTVAMQNSGSITESVPREVGE